MKHDPWATVQRIVGFDFDGTLVESFAANPLPRVAERLHTLQAAGHRLVVITNQAGPVWRAATGDDKFPTAHAVAGNIRTAFAALDWRPDALTVCVASGKEDIDINGDIDAIAREMEIALRPLRDQGVAITVAVNDAWRKPKPLALQDAQIDLYVGDMDSDRQAAQAAGVEFIHADEFFA